MIIYQIWKLPSPGKNKNGFKFKVQKIVIKIIRKCNN